jgi:hypothetical protein
MLPREIQVESDYQSACYIEADGEHLKATLTGLFGSKNWEFGGIIWLPFGRMTAEC